MTNSANATGGILRVLLWNIGFIIALLLLGELIARLTISYNPSYYTSIDAKEREVVFPYGTIRYNALGHPDDEFDLADPRPRVAYVGDSVTLGVGAGYGHRFSDLLEDSFPGYQHMTLASIGAGFRTEARMREVTEMARELGVQQVFYIYNLNDTLPNGENFAGEQPSAVKDDDSSDLLYSVVSYVRYHTEFLRDQSYLFNWVRFKARIALLRLGIDYDGEPAFEMFPDENAAVFDEVAGRILYLRDLLEEARIGLTVVILPYEMQISKDAEDTYRNMGIHWGDGLLSRRPQALLAEHLENELPLVDLYAAFVRQPEERERTKVGELFVFNEGDSLDWNHPNRAGHARIAAFLAENAVFRRSLPGKTLVDNQPSARSLK